MNLLSCPICSSNKLNNYHDFVWQSPERKVMLCDSCGSYSLFPLLTKDEQSDFDKQYDKYISKRAGFVNEHIDEEFDDLVEDSIEERYRDVEQWFPQGVSVLEIGAEKGGFLDRISQIASDITAVDACPEYTDVLAKKGYPAYKYITEVPEYIKFDRICFYSLLEHIVEPIPFLSSVKKHLAPDGYVVIEIPSAKEPLIDLYSIEEFKTFYFQAMHPYVYSEDGVRYVLEKAGLEVFDVQYKQRYGLSNHLGWLKNGTPGGVQYFSEIFSSNAEIEYIKSLELSGNTDTIYIIAKHANSEG
mgnify:CR=1 FL=1